jgi:hypothetical protein
MDVRWRRWLLILCALALVATGAMFWMERGAAALGFAIRPTGVPHVGRIVVAPGGAAESSGLRTGDLVDTRLLAPGARFRLSESPRSGEPITVPVARAGVAMSFIVIPRPRPTSWDSWLFYATQLWVTGFCAVLAWRRSDSGEARILMLLLLFAVVIGQFTWLTPNVVFDAVTTALDRAVLWGSFLLLIAYANLFGRPISTFRRVLTYVAVLSVGFTVTVAVWRVLAVWQGYLDPHAFVPGRRTVMLVSCLCVLVAAIVAARGPERTRVLWATASFAPVMLWASLADTIPALAANYNTVTNALFILIPIVLTYSLLSRRLIDFEFIVNRAAIFTVVSIILVGAFFLIESLLSDWLRSESHTTNVLFGALLALALGFSMRFVHTRVDRFVDEVFFKKRHDDEAAIAAFAGDAPYVTDASTLIERTKLVLEKHTDAKSVTVVLDDDGRYGGAGENDPAIVRLRATHKPVDLHEVPSQLPGELAFPMVARGHLVGAIVLDARRSGESYAPDESAAIAQLANSVGYGLDVLSSSAHRNGELLSAIEALRAEFRAQFPAPS